MRGQALRRTIAIAVAEQEPSLVTAEFKKAERGGRVFLDYTRSRMGQHIVAVFSPRARPGAAVSFPVAWRDLEGVEPQRFTIRSVPGLLERGDPWKALVPSPQSLPRELVG